MIKSMTAFARSQRSAGFGTLVCELKSVNHRFLEIFLRLPDELRVREIHYREQIGRVLRRGKVECQFRLQLQPDKDAEIQIDRQRASAVVRASQVINDLLHQPSEVDPMEILAWPGVVRENEIDLTPVMAAADTLLEQALDELLAGRRREGERLAAVLRQRCEAMQAIVDETRTIMPQIQQRYREKMLARLEQLKQEIDTDRMEQELLHMAQKMDVEEELDRLDSHLQEMKTILDSDDAIGRRLDFLMQELNREANTLGSKSADIASTRSSVELKVLIEQMREQIQNIE